MGLLNKSIIPCPFMSASLDWRNITCLINHVHNMYDVYFWSTAARLPTMYEFSLGEESWYITTTHTNPTQDGPRVTPTPTESTF